MQDRNNAIIESLLFRNHHLMKVLDVAKDIKQDVKVGTDDAGNRIFTFNHDRWLQLLQAIGDCEY